MAASPFSKRAQAQISFYGWVGITFLAILIPCIIFCIIVGIIVWRRKIAFKKRQQVFQQEQEERSLMAQQRLEQETWARDDSRGSLGQGSDGPIELQSGVVGAGPLMLDGYAAPASLGYDGKPLELPAQVAR